jgi:ABC-2 type transport system permease protein
MSVSHLTASGRIMGPGAMLTITARIQRRAALIWALVLGASLIGTAVSVAGLYDTPAKIHTYAQAVTSGNALVAINGKVEGIDSLGGVIQDEFGFMAAFLLPLLGISLMARATRREEESGRLELLLGGRVARHQPVLAALVVAVATIVVTGALFTLGLVFSGVPLAGSILYALSLSALAFVFAGIAGLLAQLTLHARGVYTWSLIVLAASYLVRGIGDATTTWVTWLSPLGWAEKTAPFGDQRWGVLAIPLVVGLALAGAGLWLAGRRDLGSALVRGGAGPERAGTWLVRPIGLAARVHRPAALGWLTGGVMLTGTMGALSQQLLDAMAGNPALADALGISHARPIEGFVAATQLYLAVIAAGYVVQAIGTLQVEEAEGRLETRLSGTLSRSRWLASHSVVVLTGLITIVLCSSLVLGLATALSAGDPAELGPIMTSGLAYLPAELVLAGLALAIYGLRPPLFAVAWGGYAVVTFIAFLGPGLEFRPWVLDLSPTTHVGNPPVGTIQPGPLTMMTAIAIGLIGLGFSAFRRRGVPQG